MSGRRKQGLANQRRTSRLSGLMLVLLITSWSLPRCSGGCDGDMPRPASRRDQGINKESPSFAIPPNDAELGRQDKFFFGEGTCLNRYRTRSTAGSRTETAPRSISSTSRRQRPPRNARRCDHAVRDRVYDRNRPGAEKEKERPGERGLIPLPPWSNPSEGGSGARAREPARHLKTDGGCRRWRRGTPDINVTPPSTCFWCG